MLDLIVLFTLFIGLVVGLALLQQWMASSPQDPKASKKLLEEWLQAHKLELPSVQCIISILNRRFQEIESEDWEKLELTGLLPRTELPQFRLLQAELSADNRDITLSCNVEWPMCLPGVGVSILEKGAESPVLCHFMIDWLTAQIRVVLGEKNGELMLSYENLQPIRMGVACMVTEGNAQEPERVASMAADAIQQMLMDLQLDCVPLVPLYGHTPPLPLVLVSTPEDVVPAPHDQTEPTPSESTMSADESLPNSTSSTSVPSDSDVPSQLTGSESEVTTPSVVDIMTPILEEQGPISSNASPPPPAAPAVIRTASVDDPQETDTKLSNGPSPAEGHPTIDQPDSIKANHKQQQGDDDTPTVAPATSATPPMSPGWRRSSLENLQEIEMPLETSKRVAIKGSSSSDHLASTPTHIESSPAGKRLTLSVAGSEAESIYGADERIPSTLVFEVSDSIKVRHIVALSTAHASKLRRHFSNAKKLHIYNDHSFVATHLKHKVDCAVCKEKISKSFGKQGYVCRDCSTMVHKPCHYKIESTCPSSTVSSMNLIYPDNISLSGL